MKRTTFFAAALSFASLASIASAADPLQQLRDYLKTAAPERASLEHQPFATTPLSKADAEAARQLLWEDRVAALKIERADEWKSQSIAVGDKTMRLAMKTYGGEPEGGRSLYIAMHGGGSTPPEVNDQQWKMMQTLYKPTDCLYVAPRAPTDTWNLWHEPHIDVMFGRLIEDAILFAGVNPDHVYLMGYSAGGDGVYQLAPRMADRFAAAAMMAGHPNDASPLGLRNLPFTIHVGALDSAYKRNDVAKQWGDKLDALQKADPAGYVHEVLLHPGRGHGLMGEDAVTLPWMAKFKRDPTPDKVVWKQGNALHDQFYWLAVPQGTAKKDQTAIVRRDGQHIDIELADGLKQLTLLFNDRMLDLDQPVVVTQAGKTLFNARLPRTVQSLSRSLADRADPAAAFSARVTVELGQ